MGQTPILLPGRVMSAVAVSRAFWRRLHVVREGEVWRGHPGLCRLPTGMAVLA